ncbi:MAG: hypothetical protein IKN30_05910 [Synergistaceae bacterium]|nr:hypothetical protein [Synergistaceae bacterium]MBR6901579.1 hypothetical protein [Synergistaceae bacterium]
MKNSSRFFCNKACEYFPCHQGLEEINCLFCYCPLYKLKDCGGNFQILANGCKDCSNCTLPHKPVSYEYIVRRLTNAES